jgi:hypothetical protein
MGRDDLRFAAVRFLDREILRAFVHVTHNEWFPYLSQEPGYVTIPLDDHFQVNR